MAALRSTSVLIGKHLVCQKGKTWNTGQIYKIYVISANICVWNLLETKIKWFKHKICIKCTIHLSFLSMSIDYKHYRCCFHHYLAGKFFWWIVIGLTSCVTHYQLWACSCSKLISVWCALGPFSQCPVICYRTDYIRPIIHSIYPTANVNRMSMAPK